ncbi:NAD-dependent deacylase [soil metagenome]
MSEQRPFSETLVERLAVAERVVVLTGAGVSAESGVPTFRDPDGLWQKFSAEELANVDAFLKNPTLVQSWYAHRRAVVMNAGPNPAHMALAELELLVPDFLLATQNVDGLHGRAGSVKLVELHGNLTRSFCHSCGAGAAPEHAEPKESGEPAECPLCCGLLRPDVVWFGEILPTEALEQAMAASAAADVFLAVGTSALVYPAAGLPLIASAHDAYVAEINPTASAIAPVINESVVGKAGVVLPQLLEAVRRLRDQSQERS